MQSFVTQTILAYAQPLLVQDAKDIEFLRAAMQVIVQTWNAVVFDQVLGDNSHIEDMRERLENDPTAPMVEFLISRKQKRFAEHKFAIGDWDFDFDPTGQFRLKIEARDVTTKKED